MSGLSRMLFSARPGLRTPRSSSSRLGTRLISRQTRPRYFRQPFQRSQRLDADWAAPLNPSHIPFWKHGVYLGAAIAVGALPIIALTGYVGRDVVKWMLGPQEYQRWIFGLMGITEKVKAISFELDIPEYGTPEDFTRAIEELETSFPSQNVSTDPDVLKVHGFSELDYHPSVSPSVVVYPHSTEDVVTIVKIATKYRMPVIPYSGATALEGQFRAHQTGGISVDLSQMDRILEIHEADGDVVCQAGARWMDINETLKEKGIPMFWPIDPAPGATIGGLLSTGSSGTNAVRYGTARGEWFLNATVVLPSGEVIKTRQRARKSSAGPDLTKLFIGAEGTLGIVTEVTIRLAPILPTSVAVAQFPSVRAATEAVSEILNTGVGIQCVELVDDVFMRATNTYGASKRKWAEKDSLFFKFQGPTQASLKETGEIVKKIVKKHGATGFELARNQEEAEELWADRKNAHYSGLALLPDGRGWPTDVCVPVSKLPELVHETKKDLGEIGLLSTIVGHVGDGNFHALILFRTDEEFERAKGAVERMVKRAIALDGTCTGEHGVGMGKTKYLVDELGVETVALMKAIKQTIDPLNLFNPGKLYPDIPCKPTYLDRVRREMVEKTTHKQL